MQSRQWVVRGSRTLIVAVIMLFAPSHVESADFVLARFHSDGTLDSSFGAAGIVRTSFGVSRLFGPWSSAAAALIRQPDGKLVAAGKIMWVGTCPAFPLQCSVADSALARYTPTGQLDPTFGTGGLVAR